ncbi:30S ribosomal protein S18 [Candidatus Berkelbacteria bacterium]|nr:30S ribosomal protein S18 [Candidatus Berkelbacteria bacterium]
MPRISQRSCAFCKKKIDWIDYKDAGLLRRYLGTWSKLKSAKDTSTCARHQRRLAEAVKRARYLAILPYTTR